MDNVPSVPRTEILDAQECWDLLRGVSLGRLAVLSDDHPEIFPLTYLIDRHTVVFRTGPGTKLTAALRGAPVALEVDGVDPKPNIAWSVVVKGPAALIDQSGGFLASSAQHLLPWEAGSKDYFVRITPEAVTGRRFTVAPPDAWDIPLDDATRSGLE